MVLVVHRRSADRLSLRVGHHWLLAGVGESAQYVATTSTELLDALPIFGEPIARNFLDRTSLSDCFFTLLVFLHIAVPLILLFGMWIHIQRISLSAREPAARAGCHDACSSRWFWCCVEAAISQGAARPVVPSPVNLATAGICFYILWPIVRRNWCGYSWRLAA